MIPHEQALAEGKLGVALLHIQRGDRAKAAMCLEAAVADGVSVGSNASLFHGAPALEFVLRCAGQSKPEVCEAVDGVVARRLAAAHRPREAGTRPALAEFDLIRGLTGLGALLLTRETGSPLLAEVLAYLVGLASPVRHADGWMLPGWWSDAGPDDKEMPGGHGNNGVAHGIAGPLALMSLAVRDGHTAEGLVVAIQTYAEWLEQYGGFYWITRDQLTQPESPPPSRPSWCYGALGIARARQLAALALEDPSRREAAEDAAVRALADHPTPGRLTTDAGLCHGWAGQLAVPAP